MSKSILDSILYDAIPDSLREDSNVRAIALSLDEEIQRMAAAARAVQWTSEALSTGSISASRLQELSGAQLDHVAWSWGSVVWDREWTEVQKRGYVVGILNRKKHLGTAECIRDAFSTIGIQVEVSDCMNDDTIDPGCFILYTDEPVAMANQWRMLYIVDHIKPASRHYKWGHRVAADGELVSAVGATAIVMRRIDFTACQPNYEFSTTRVAGSGSTMSAVVQLDFDTDTNYKVMLNDDGGSKITMTVAVKNVLGLGLRESKELVESAPVRLSADSNAPLQCCDECNKLIQQIRDVFDERGVAQPPESTFSIEYVDPTPAFTFPVIQFMGVPLTCARTPAATQITTDSCVIAWNGTNVYNKSDYPNACVIRYNSASGGAYSYDCADLFIDCDRYPTDTYMRLSSKGTTYTVYAYYVAYCNDSRTIGTSVVYKTADGKPYNCYTFDKDGTTYYYVLDDVQSEWTDDLEGIGYQTEQPETSLKLYFKSNKSNLSDIRSGYWYALYREDGQRATSSTDPAKEYTGVCKLYKSDGTFVTNGSASDGYGEWCGGQTSGNIVTAAYIVIPIG